MYNINKLILYGIINHDLKVEIFHHGNYANIKQNKTLFAANI